MDIAAAAPSHLDLRAFAQSARQLSGREPVAAFPRIMDECGERGQGLQVTWAARGEMRSDALGNDQVWLHLQVDATVPLICQRCMDVVETPLPVDRFFRFVADEDAAAAQDDDSEEDLLVFTGDFNLHELVEDELCLALPLIPRHEVCPTPGAFAQPGPSEAAALERPHPFAALAGLKSGKGNPAK